MQNLREFNELKKPIMQFYVRSALGKFAAYLARWPLTDRKILFSVSEVFQDFSCSKLDYKFLNAAFFESQENHLLNPHCDTRLVYACSLNVDYEPCNLHHGLQIGV